MDNIGLFRAVEPQWVIVEGGTFFEETSSPAPEVRPRPGFRPCPVVRPLPVVRPCPGDRPRPGVCPGPAFRPCPGVCPYPGVMFVGRRPTKPGDYKGAEPPYRVNVSPEG